MSVVVLSQFVGLMVSNRIAIRRARESHILALFHLHHKYQKDMKYPTPKYFKSITQDIYKYLKLLTKEQVLSEVKKSTLSLTDKRPRVSRTAQITLKSLNVAKVA